MADAGWSEADAAAVVAAAKGRTQTMQLTGSELGKLLENPLTKLGIKVPDEAECVELAIWAGSRPHGIVPAKRDYDMSPRPHRYLVALRNSIPEIEDHWNRITEFVIVQNPSNADRIKHDAGLSVTASISRLRAALEECESLVRPRVPYAESWEDTAISLLTVFGWVVARSGSNVQSGLSLTGPSMSFVCSGLELLGWRTAVYPTAAAILQMLKRHVTKKDT